MVDWQLQRRLQQLPRRQQLWCTSDSLALQPHTQISAISSFLSFADAKPLPKMAPPPKPPSIITGTNGSLTKARHQQSSSRCPTLFPCADRLMCSPPPIWHHHQSRQQMGVLTNFGDSKIHETHEILIAADLRANSSCHGGTSVGRTSKRAAGLRDRIKARTSRLCRRNDGEQVRTKEEIGMSTWNKSTGVRSRSRPQDLQHQQQVSSHLQDV